MINDYEKFVCTTFIWSNEKFAMVYFKVDKGAENKKLLNFIEVLRLIYLHLIERLPCGNFCLSYVLYISKKQDFHV